MLQQTLIATILLATACGSVDTVKSSDVNESKIHRSYTMDYDAGSQELRRSAQFRVGGATGTTVELADPSNVTLLGNGKQFGRTNSGVTGTFYSLTEVTTNPKSSETFIWTRSNASAAENELSLPVPAVAATKEGESVSKSKGYDVVLNIEASGTDDSFTATLTSDSSNSTAEQTRFAVASASSGNVIHLKAEDLAKFIEGSAKLVVKHTKTRRIPESSQDLGGILTESYTSAPIAVNVVP